jgi:hypothetical protein
MPILETIPSIVLGAIVVYAMVAMIGFPLVLWGLHIFLNAEHDSAGRDDGSRYP